MYVVIMGCGRVGSSLAGSLERLGHEVAVIDRDRQAFRRLSPDFRGRQVVGEGYHRDVLTEAGVERAQALAWEPVLVLVGVLALRAAIIFSAQA